MTRATRPRAGMKASEVDCVCLLTIKVITVHRIRNFLFLHVLVVQRGSCVSIVKIHNDGEM